MTSGRSNIIDVECEFVHVTGAALLVKNGNEKIWLPLSMIEYERGRGNSVTVSLPENFALEKGLI